ncbi:MAG: hypothetical protein ACPGU1_07780 [Myxococcota bacterium]
MYNHRWTLLIVATLGLGCETYDPPPSVSLVPAPSGQYDTAGPVELSFSEPVASSSLAVSVWCTGNRDEEGEFALDPSDAVTHHCVPDVCPQMSDCGEVQACLDSERTSAKLSFTGEVCSEDSWQAWIVVEAGLTDDAGNDTGVPEAFSLMLWPADGPTGDAVGQDGDVVTSEDGEAGPGDTPLTLNSGVVTLISSLSDGNEAIAGIYPSLYMRLLVDLASEPETGTTWMLATVARLSDEAKARNATSEVPTDRSPIVDDEGWAVLIMGEITPNLDGTFDLETVPTDVTVWVLGTIKVVLKDFQLIGLITPGEGDDERDTLAGILQTTDAEITLGAPSPLGAVNAIFTGDGLFENEVSPDLPRLCSEAPCETLLSQGGDCQLPLPWEKPSICP